MSQRYTDNDSALGSANGVFDITPAVGELDQSTRMVMVDTDGTTVTGTLIADSDENTTFALKAGIMYPFRFKEITAVTGGSAKGYF